MILESNYFTSHDLMHVQHITLRKERRKVLAQIKEFGRKAGAPHTYKLIQSSKIKSGPPECPKTVGHILDLKKDGTDYTFRVFSHHSFAPNIRIDEKASVISFAQAIAVKTFDSNGDTVSATYPKAEPSFLDKFFAHLPFTKPPADVFIMPRRTYEFMCGPLNQDKGSVSPH